jgi:hypothetical protein
MVLVYASVLLLLTGASVLIRRRAASLEKKYAAVLKEAHTMLRDPPREGNSARCDPYQSARRTYQLGALAQKKDRLEAKHYAWQARAERVGRWRKGLANWKGRKFPYLLGLVDAVVTLCVLEYFGYGRYTNPRYLVDLVTTWISG